MDWPPFPPAAGVVSEDSGGPGEQGQPVSPPLCYMSLK